MKNRKWFSIMAYGLLLVSSTVLLAGCWDSREVQNRNIVLAAAVDLAEEGTEKSTRLETFTQGLPGKPLRLSLQVLTLSPPTKGGGDQERGRTFVLSNTGRTLFEMVRDMYGQTSKPLWFEHIQVIIISEAAVKQYGLKPLLDFFRRDAEQRWRTKLYITPQEARKLLEFQPPTGEPGGIYFGNISRLYMKNPHISGAGTDLGTTSIRMDNQADLVLPVIELVEKQVKVNSLAVFKKTKFIGYWDEYTIKGNKMLLGLEKSALISFRCPIHPEDTVVFELFRHDTYMKAHVNNDQISFTVDIAMRGNLGEATCAARHDTTAKEYTEKAEELFAAEVKHNIEYSVQIMQRYGADVANMGLYLKAYEPKTWAKVKDNWDEIFPTIPVHIKVQVSINAVGEHN